MAKKVETIKYPVFTPEQFQAIKDVFQFKEYNPAQFEISVKSDGYYIRVAQMYEYIGFKHDLSVLQAYMKIANILGVEDGDEWSRYSSGGCETCDYGSSYEITLRFW